MTGATRNPFSAARFEPGVVPWFETAPGALDRLDRLADRACARAARLQIVGPHGSGKTTLLAKLEREAERRGLRVCRARGSKLRFAALRLGSVDLLLLDEAEELGRLGLAALRVFTRLAGAGLIVTAHRDLGFPTLARREVSPLLAARIVEHLLGGTGWETPAPEELATRLERHRGNLREVLFELYDDVERCHASARTFPVFGCRTRDAQLQKTPAAARARPRRLRGGLEP